MHSLSSKIRSKICLKLNLRSVWNCENNHRVILCRGYKLCGEIMNVVLLFLYVLPQRLTRVWEVRYPVRLSTLHRFFIFLVSCYQIYRIWRSPARCLIYSTITWPSMCVVRLCLTSQEVVAGAGGSAVRQHSLHSVCDVSTNNNNAKRWRLNSLHVIVNGGAVVITRT
jgi:hypothetical protein